MVNAELNERGGEGVDEGHGQHQHRAPLSEDCPEGLKHPVPEMFEVKHVAARCDKHYARHARGRKPLPVDDFRRRIGLELQMQRLIAKGRGKGEIGQTEVLSGQEDIEGAEALVHCPKVRQ